MLNVQARKGGRFDGSFAHDGVSVSWESIRLFVARQSRNDEEKAEKLMAYP